MQLDNFYRVNWKKLVRILLLTKNRKPLYIEWLYGLIVPVNELHIRLTHYRANVAYRIGITTQVCYLEKLLNDHFDVVDRRIRIVKPVYYNPLVFFQKTENKPIKFFTEAEGDHKVLYTKAETALYTVDFIVEIPVHVAFDMDELTELLNRYIAQSKTFKVRIV